MKRYAHVWRFKDMNSVLEFLAVPVSEIMGCPRDYNTTVSWDIVDALPSSASEFISIPKSLYTKVTIFVEL
jgi:hypothetical protein